MEAIKFINLTPHPVNIVNPETEEITHTFQSEGSVRVGTEMKDTDNPLIKTVNYTELNGLPQPQDGVVYILSTIAYDAAKAQGRTDICFPTGRMFRDKKGQIKGVECLGVKREVATIDPECSLFDRLYKKVLDEESDSQERREHLTRVYQRGLEEGQGFFSIVKQIQKSEKLSDLNDKQIINIIQTVNGYNYI
jgi:hypothetical protein